MEASDILWALIIALPDNCGPQTRPREFSETARKIGKSTISRGCSFFRLFIEKTSLALNVALTGRGYLLPASSPGEESLSRRTLGEKFLFFYERIASGEEVALYNFMRAFRVRNSLSFHPLSSRARTPP